jgi:hypothetical protein
VTEPSISWRDLVAGLTEGLNRASQDIPRQINAAMLGFVEQYRPALEGLARFASDFREAYDEGVPPTWQQLTSPQIIGVIRLMERTGWCLTATPPPETLSALLEASDDDRRREILLSQEPRILEDLEVELRAIDGDPLAILTTASREALEAHRSGFFRASQALSANGLAALLASGGPFGLKSLGAARNQLRALDIEDAGMREIRFVAVAGAVAQVFANFPDGGPPPPFFNRHATAHAISNEGYSQLNSLMAVGLLIGFLREVKWLIQVGERDAN